MLVCFLVDPERRHAGRVCLDEPGILPGSSGKDIAMDNPGFYLVAWLLIAPVIAALFLSGIGSSRTTSRHDNSL